MPKLKTLNASVAESRALENMRADIERNKANTDYIAMMADVVLPEPQEEMGVPHNEE